MQKQTKRKKEFVVSLLDSGYGREAIAVIKSHSFLLNSKRRFFELAVRWNLLDVVDLLLDDADPRVFSGTPRSLRMLAFLHKDERVDFSSQFRSWFFHLARCDNSDCVVYMIQHDLVTARDKTKAILTALTYGNLKVLQLLLDVENIALPNNLEESIREASENKEFESVEMFLRDKRVNITFDIFMTVRKYRNKACIEAAAQRLDEQDAMRAIALVIEDCDKLALVALAQREDFDNYSPECVASASNAEQR